MKILNNKYARVVGVATAAAVMLSEPALAQTVEPLRISVLINYWMLLVRGHQLSMMLF